MLLILRQHGPRYIIKHRIYNNKVVIIKTNIMKSIYSQAASKGFRIFGDKKVTDYMSASSYVKVGG